MEIFWLILVVTGYASGAGVNANTPTIMHVGNFSSFTDCQKFGASFTVPVTAQNGAPQITMLCIQANESGTQPPPG